MAGVFLGDDEVIPEDDLFDPEVEEIIELAASRIRGLAHRNKKGRGGVRYVRTPEGARFYGQPIGSPITADIIAAAERRNGKRAPKTALAYEPPAKRPTSATGSRPNAIGDHRSEGPHPVETPKPSGVQKNQNAASRQASTPRDPNSGSSQPPRAKISSPEDNDPNKVEYLTVGKATHPVPSGSTVIAHKLGDVSYVKTPDGGVRAFSVRGELTDLSDDERDNIRLLFKGFEQDPKSFQDYQDGETTPEAPNPDLGSPVPSSEWLASSPKGTQIQLGDNEDNIWTKADDGLLYSNEFGIVAGPPLDPRFLRLEPDITVVSLGEATPQEDVSAVKNVDTDLGSSLSDFYVDLEAAVQGLPEEDREPFMEILERVSAMPSSDGSTPGRRKLSEYERPVSVEELDAVESGRSMRTLEGAKYTKTDEGWISEKTGRVAPSTSFKNLAENDKLVLMDDDDDQGPAPVDINDPEEFKAESERARDRNLRKSEAASDPEQKKKYADKAAEYDTNAKEADIALKGTSASGDQAPSGNSPKLGDRATQEALDQSEVGTVVSETDILTGRTVRRTKKEDGRWYGRGDDEGVDSDYLAESEDAVFTQVPGEKDLTPSETEKSEPELDYADDPLSAEPGQFVKGVDESGQDKDYWLVPSPEGSERSWMSQEEGKYEPTYYKDSEVVASVNRGKALSEVKSKKAGESVTVADSEGNSVTYTRTPFSGAEDSEGMWTSSEGERTLTDQDVASALAGSLNPPTPTVKRPGRLRKRRPMPKMGDIPTGGSGANDDLFKEGDGSTPTPSVPEVFPKAADFEELELPEDPARTRPGGSRLVRKNKDNPEVFDNPEGPDISVSWDDPTEKDWYVAPGETISRDWFNQALPGAVFTEVSPKEGTVLGAWEKGIDGVWRKQFGKDGHHEPRSWGKPGNTSLDHNFNIFDSETGELLPQFANYQVEHNSDPNWQPPQIPEHYNRIVAELDSLKKAAPGSRIAVYVPQTGMRVDRVYEVRSYVVQEDGKLSMTSASGLTVDDIPIESLVGMSRHIYWAPPGTTIAGTVNSGKADPHWSPDVSPRARHMGNSFDPDQVPIGGVVYRVRTDAEITGGTSPEKVYSYRKIGPDAYIGSEFTTNSPASAQKLLRELGGEFWIDDSPEEVQEYEKYVQELGPGAHLNDIAPGFDRKDLPESLDYYADERIAKFSHLFAQPEGTVVRVAGNDVDTFDSYIIRQEDGWHRVSPDFTVGERVSLADYGNIFTDPERGMFMVTFGGDDFLENPEVDVPLFRGGPSGSMRELGDAIESLRSANLGTQITRVTSSLPDGHPLKDPAVVARLVTLAQRRYPNLDTKESVARYLENVMGRMRDAKSRDSSSPRVSLGAPDGQRKVVAGATDPNGIDLTKDEIQSAIDLLKGSNSTMVKNILRNANHPLGTTDPMSLLAAGLEQENNGLPPEIQRSMPPGGDRAARKLSLIEYLERQLAADLETLRQDNSSPTPLPRRPVPSPPAAPIVSASTEEALQRVDSATTAQEIVDAFNSVFPRTQVSNLNRLVSSPEVGIEGIRSSFRSLIVLGDKYPHVVPTLYSLKLGQRKGRDANVGGWVQPGSRARGWSELFLNWGGPAYEKSGFESTISSGHHHAEHGSDPRAYVVTHEFGHLLHYGFGVDQARAITARLQQILLGYARNSNARMSEVSKYAGSSSSELIAEAFATVELHPNLASPTERFVYDEFMKLIEEVLNGKAV